MVGIKDFKNRELGKYDSKSKTFHIWMRKSEKWVRGQGWPIEDCTLYRAKEAGAELVSVHDDDNWEIWTVDIQLLEEAGYQDYPNGKPCRFIERENWEVVSLEYCQ